jgi:hypothetical protein
LGHDLIQEALKWGDPGLAPDLTEDPGLMNVQRRHPGPGALPQTSCASG